MKYYLAALVILPSWLMAQEDMDFERLARNCLGDQDPASCIGIAASVCMETTEGGQSTFGMMSCFLAERDNWDVLLNEEYAHARSFAKSRDASDQELFPQYAIRDDQVLAAQRAWIAFRDANCAMQYGLWGGGSMRQISGALCQMQMTAERAITLRNYHTGVQ